MSRPAEWAARPERGDPRLLAFMIRLGLWAGRPVARLILGPISVYFWLASRAARRDSARYLSRLWQRPARPTETFRHIHAFSSVVLDRLYLLAGRGHELDVRVSGHEHVAAHLAENRGVVLMGAHLGSFEALRTLARAQQGLRVTMAMYEDNAQMIGAYLRQIDPSLADDIVSLGRIDSMLRLQERLERGDCVAFLADRAFAGDQTLEHAFLGVPAPFPLGPFRMAAILRRPVLLMAGLYQGGNRYDVRIEPLGDFRDVGRRERSAAIEITVRRFATRLEALCHESPYNWFNFYDFWQPGR